MDALGQPGSRTPRRLAVAAVALGLVVTGIAVWQARGPDQGRREPAVELAADAPLKLRRDPAEPTSPVRSLAVPLGVGAGARTLERTSSGARTAQLSTSRFAMLGLTWHGDRTPRLAVRTRPVGAGWTPWRTAPELEDRSATEGSPDLRATDPIWVGASDGVQVRVRGGSPHDLELTLIDPGVLPSDAQAAGGTTGGTTGGATGGTTGAGRAPVGFGRSAVVARSAPRPTLYSRKRWGADPSWRNGRPEYNRVLKQVHIHHTASSNDYSAADVPAILRGIYRYHTKTLGWFDIAYNFLVDKFGRAWVGRSGGPTRLVRGAHTLGFNHESTGIAMIGSYDTGRPTKRAMATLVALSAWKLGAAHVNPAGWMRAQSKGSDRYPAGQRVALPVIDGHRDTNETACPGLRLYQLIQKVRERAAARVARYGR